MAATRPVHHVGRRHHVRAGVGIGQRGLDERLQRDVVLHLAVLHDPAVSVVGVRTEADIGHHDQIVAELRLEPPQGGRDRAGGISRRNSVRSLGAGVSGLAEQQDGTDPGLDFLRHLPHEIFDAQVRDPRERRDRGLPAQLAGDEMGHYAVRGGHVRFRGQIADRPIAPEPPGASPPGWGDDSRTQAIASMRPSRLGRSASAATVSPADFARRDVEGPIVKISTGTSSST